MKSLINISKIQLAVLISGTVCYLVALFLGPTYKDILLTVSLLFLGMYMALKAIENYIKFKCEIEKSNTPAAQGKNPEPDTIIIGRTSTGKTAEYEMLTFEDSVDMLEKDGYKVHTINLESPSGRLYNPSESRYDIFGAERKAFVEKLSNIFKLTIIEEDDNHIRIAYVENNYVVCSEEEQEKLYSKFANLMNSVKGTIEMIKVQDN